MFGNDKLQLVTIAQAMQWAYQNIDRIDARMLLEYVLQVNHAFLLTHPDQVLSSTESECFYQLVIQRIEGMPVAYLTNERAFYDLVFNVTTAVLIPRPETELLVDLALAKIPINETCRVLDLGTGSGIIAVTIAKHRPRANVVAIDLSVDAVSIARINANKLGINNISIIQGDWFNGLIGEKFNLVVSNPPYIAVHDPHLEQGDLRFEPRIALTSDEDGLACIRDIIRAAPIHLHPGGWLLLEHGYNQAAACRQLLIDESFSNIFSQPDLAGIIRVSGGQYNCSP